MNEIYIPKGLIDHEGLAMYSLEAIARMNQQAIEKHRKEREARLRELVKNCGRS